MPDIVGKDLKYIRLNDKDLIGRCMENGHFEGYVVMKAVELLQNVPMGSILDIGANMGTFTLPLAYYNPKYVFVCFEPQRMVFNQLCGNLAINGIQNVHTINCGLGESEYFVDVYDGEDHFVINYDIMAHSDEFNETKSVKVSINLFICSKDVACPLTSMLLVKKSMLKF